MSIYIKPENRGKFNATKKRTGKTTEELTHSKNALTRKRAIFAQNAAKWKHDLGGVLSTYANGGKLPPSAYLNQSNVFGEGGTHEQNPNGGIPQGMGANGRMNTVEQGEVSYTFEDGKYIFSNRLS